MVTVQVGEQKRTAAYEITDLRGAVATARFRPETVLEAVLDGLRAKYGRKCHDVSGSR